MNSIPMKTNRVYSVCYNKFDRDSKASRAIGILYSETMEGFGYALIVIVMRMLGVS